MTEVVNESNFYMWRAIFAMAHADGVVTEEESDFLREYMSNLNFTEEQLAMLEEDLRRPQDIGEMFFRISSPSDKAQFFYFARLLAWCDGDFDEQEKVIIEKLKTSHMADLNIDQISKSVRESAELVAADLNEKGISDFSFWEKLRKFPPGEDEK